MCCKLALSMMTLALCACEAGTDAGRPQPVAPADPEAMLRQALTDDLDTRLRQALEGEIAQQTLADLLKEPLKTPKRKLKLEGSRFAHIAQAFYVGREGALAWVSLGGGLEPRADAALDVLRHQADRHALEEPLGLASIEAQLKAWRASPAPIPQWPETRLSSDELKATIAWMRAKGLADDRARAQETLVHLLSGVGERLEPPPTLAPRRAAVDAYRRAHSARVQQAFRLELAIGDALMRYARELRHANISRDDWRDFKAAGGSLALIASRTQTFLEALAEAEPQATREALEALAPSHPQYRRLQSAHLRYGRLIREGGWDELRAQRLVKGASRGGALRARLIAQGYSAGAGPRVDEALITAIEAFQEDHQLKREGLAGLRHKAFWAAINVSPESRLAEIERGLRHWRRESFYRDEDDFLMVNLPDYHGELYRSGERVRRFKVVIGGDERSCDKDRGIWRWPNRTPVQWSAIDKMILNPFWYVPRRLVEEELGPKLESGSSWLEERGYEVYKRRGQRLWVRQKPGPHNALGQVKFLFESPHNTYLHDTPRKVYFNETKRALSHGCVRVHEPLKLAADLLQGDAQDKEVSVEEVIASGRQKVVEFKRPVAVFLEYITVWVEPEGRVRFLDDVYARHRADEGCGKVIAKGSGAAKAATSLRRGDIGP